MDIAQLARAPDCGSGGRRFETDYPPHIKRRIINRLLFVVRLIFLLWDVAKRLRQRTLTPSPAGSNPAIPASVTLDPVRFLGSALFFYLFIPTAGRISFLHVGSVTLDPVFLWVQRYFLPFHPDRNLILFVSCLQSVALCANARLSLFCLNLFFLIL